jgi:hypothetical protein
MKASAPSNWVDFGEVDDQRLRKKEPKMLIIRADYHPSFQQIAFVDMETGECGAQGLNHSRGEAECFYRGLIWAAL